MPALTIEIIRKCKICGDHFRAKTLDSWYCTPRCGKIASKRKTAEIKRQLRLDDAVKMMDKQKVMLTVQEAYALFGVSRETIYRLIRKGEIASVNMGKRQTLVSKEELHTMFPYRRKALSKPKVVPKVYHLEPSDCYTIGEVCKKYKLNDSSVWTHVRKYSIPSRQIGNFVYVPKREIDEIYKGAKI